MAYFSKGSEGMCFDEECSTCKYGEEPCPIYNMQLEFNYKACNNEVASQILNSLVRNDGTCIMKQMFRKDFYIDTRQSKIEFD